MKTLLGLTITLDTGRTPGAMAHAKMAMLVSFIDNHRDNS